MRDTPVIPVRITLLDNAMLVDVGVGHAKGTTSIIPMTSEDMQRLRDACPDDACDDDWRKEAGGGT